MIICYNIIKMEIKTTAECSSSMGLKGRAEHSNVSMNFVLVFTECNGVSDGV